MSMNLLFFFNEPWYQKIGPNLGVCLIHECVLYEDLSFKFKTHHDLVDMQIIPKTGSGLGALYSSVSSGLM